MKAVTIHVEELVYKDFQKIARRTKRSTSEVIREAMASYRQRQEKDRIPLWRATEPASVGRVLKPWAGRGDLIGDFFDRE